MSISDFWTGVFGSVGRVFKLDLAMPVPPDTSPEVNEAGCKVDWANA